MKKTIITILVLGLCVLFASSAMAISLGGEITEKAAKKAGYGAATETTFAETLGTVIKAALSFVGVIFLMLMVYAGYLWMTARGEEDQITKAKNIITSSIIGLIITVGAYSITSFVVPKILEKTTGEAPTAGAPMVGCCKLKCTGELFGECVSGPEYYIVGGKTDCDAKCPVGDTSNCEFSEKPANQCL